MPVCSVIDISHYNWERNPNLDFQRAKDGGLVGVIAKASEGGTWRDSTYQQSREMAQDAGLLWGAYHFATGADPKSQIKNFFTASAPDESTLMCIDFEHNGPTNTASIAQVLELLDRTAQRLGRQPTVYTGPYMYQLLQKARDENLAQYRVWWARYADAVGLHPTWQNYWLWQYTDGHSGPQPRHVDGIGYCDCNHFNGSIEALVEGWAGQTAEDANAIGFVDLNVDAPQAFVAQVGSATDQWATLPIDSYLLQNNFQHRLPGAAKQSIFVNADQTCGWQWNWPARPDLAVVAYPEVICGKKPWDTKSTTQQLPARVGDVLALVADYATETHASGIYNLAFDVWLCDHPAAQEENIHTEVMVWLDANGLPPAGAIIDSFDTPWGAVDLYREDMPKWLYLACVFRNPLPQATLDLNVFLNHLVALGLIDPKLFLASVELGNEVSQGSGHTLIQRYTVEIATTP